MAKFLSRLFGSNSSSKNSSFRGSQTSLNDTQNRSRISSSVRTSASLENLSSYHVNPKELEKNKLHKASWEGNLHKVERLAQPGQINLKDQHMRTPIHLAIVKGHIDIVKYLVQRQAKLDVVDNEQRTPLVKAVLSGNQNLELNYQICRVLLDGGPAYYINAADKHGKNALHYSIDFGNQRLVQLFLSNENCDPNYQDRDQMTPLHLAIKRNSPEIVRLLLSDQRDQQADPNIANRFGQTPLHMAASVGYLEIVRLLLQSKLHEPCDPTILDSYQATAYELARANHQEACARLIEEYQEKVYKSPRRATSTSYTEQMSPRATNSISMVPASNLERGNDDTSDDSSSVVSTSKPSKSSPRRMKRPSDQWSDDANLSKIESRRKSHDLSSLLKSNPLQSEPATKQKSTLGALFSNNPLQSDTKKTARSDKPTISSQPSHPFFGIGPVIERVDSDNTSTSMSVNNLVKSTAPLPPQNKSSIPTVVRPASTTKSWSDDTITAPVPKPNQTKAREPQSDTWDSSVSDDGSTVPKVNHVVSNLVKTQPLTAPTTNHPATSDSDDNSVETEIRRLDLGKPSNAPTVQNLVNKQIGNGYKVIGISEVQSPQSDDSSWTTSPLPVNQQPTTHHPVRQEKNDESTWDDSRPLSADIRHADKQSSTVQSTGVGNLVKVTDTIVPSEKKPSTQSSTVLGKLVVSSMAKRSEPTSHEIDVEEDYDKSWKNKSEEWSVASAHEPDSKTIRPLPRTSVPHDVNSLHGSTSSTKSSFNDLNELKENIKRLERNQEDTHELKRQLKEMENKKNDFEKLYKENDQILRVTQEKLEREKTEKQRLQSTTYNLDSELNAIRQKLQSIEDEKRQLNQRCFQLQEERDVHDEKLRTLQANSLQSTAHSNSSRSDDLDQINNRHRNEMRSLSAANDDVHHRNQKLQSDLKIHKDTLDEAVRYKIDLEKALEEKTFFQRELDRFKYEKELVEQERMVYKTKYDGLQDEIRQILLDRSKLEQKLTTELQEHMQEKQRSTDDIRKYRTEIGELNMRLADAETSLQTLQSQNQTLLTTKDRDTMFSQRSNQLPPHPEQSYRKPLTIQTSTLPANHLTQRPPPPHSGAQTLPQTFEHRSQDNDRYLLKTSQQIRSDTERVKNELDLLRQDFDRLVSNYETHPTSHSQTQLHSQIDIFRQFYEQEFRQRQSQMSKLTAGMKPIARHASLSKPDTHDHSHNGTSSCTACTNTRLLRERLETAIDTSLAEQRLQTLEQLPRQASSLLTINTNNQGVMSSVELLRGYYNA